MSQLAGRLLELHLQGRVRFGVGAIEALPGLVAAVGDEGPGARSQVFIVTDPGVLKSGVIDRVLGVLEVR